VSNMDAERPFRPFDAMTPTTCPHASL
jgi:hypothetical protein